MYDDIFANSGIITPQKTLTGHVNTYWTYTVKYMGDDWFEFYNEVKESGGDGFYGGLSVPFQEPVMKKYDHIAQACPNAAKVQPRMMQFKTNYRNLDIARKKIESISKVIKKRGMK